MTRTEENNKALEECSHTISTEAQRTVLLADISKSLAVIADVMSGAQEPTKTSEEAKRLADEACERIMLFDYYTAGEWKDAKGTPRGDLTGGPNHAHR